MTKKKRSWLEIHFSWYLEELKAKGYIIDYVSQPDSWTIFDKAMYTYRKKMITKTKEVTTGIPDLPRMIYTPDFQIEWTQRAKWLFWQDIYGGDKLEGSPFLVTNSERPVSIIEIKPEFDSRNMTRGIKPKILRMWEFYKIYVQIVTPEIMFAETFTPKRYLFCDVLENRKRKIDYPVRMLREYGHIMIYKKRKNIRWAK